MSISNTKTLFDATDPNGTVYNNISIPQLVRMFNLNKGALYKFIGKIVPEVLSHTSQMTESRKNTSGWCLIPVSQALV